VALAAIYLCYLAVINIWNINYPIQLVGVCLNLILIYALGISRGAQDRGSRHLILLGSYSLFGYIAQIAILQILYKVLRHIDLGIAGLALSCLAAFALTMAGVELLDRVRRRLVIVDTLYRAVFA
jgi:peptidoglycan/LPS O-acetylase OafA/YrhL